MHTGQQLHTKVINFYPSLLCMALCISGLCNQISQFGIWDDRKVTNNYMAIWLIQMAWGVTFTLRWIVVKVVIIQVWKCWWKVEYLIGNSRLCVGVRNYWWFFFLKVSWHCFNHWFASQNWWQIYCINTFVDKIKFDEMCLWHLYLEYHCGQVWTTCIGLCLKW